MYIRTQYQRESHKQPERRTPKQQQLQKSNPRATNANQNARTPQNGAARRHGEQTRTHETNAKALSANHFPPQPARITKMQTAQLSHFDKRKKRTNSRSRPKTNNQSKARRTTRRGLVTRYIEKHSQSCRAKPEHVLREELLDWTGLDSSPPLAAGFIFRRPTAQSMAIPMAQSMAAHGEIYSSRFISGGPLLKNRSISGRPLKARCISGQPLILHVSTCINGRPLMKADSRSNSGFLR